MALKIIQLTDCHVPGDPARPYRGVDPRATLERLLTTVQAFAPDLVLASGDLSEDAHPQAYSWLKHRFDGLNAPVMALPGNHDDAAVMAEHFPATATDRAVVFQAGGWQVIGLNSAVPGEVPGRISTGQQQQLRALLGGDAIPTLIALHHQPVPVGSPWIDKYPLLEPDGFWACLRGHAHVRAVTWGHIHQAIDLVVDGIPAYGSPSTASNSLPGCERFTPDPAGPAARWFSLGDEGALETGVIYSNSD